MPPAHRETDEAPGGRIVVIGGPTAIGKTALAVTLAEQVDGEIVNADSMQVYRRMDVGTAKPTAEERARARFHLVDHVEPTHPYNAGDFVTEADAAIAAIRARGRAVIVCGGTGMYIRSLVRGLFPAPPVNRTLREQLYAEEEAKGPGTLHGKLAKADPARAKKIPAADLLRIVRALEVIDQTGVPMSEHLKRHERQRPRYETQILCLENDRDFVYARIDARVDAMMEAGFLDEVRSLLDQGVARGANAMQGLGYRQLAAHLAGETDLAEAVRLTKRDTRRFAKRQWTWFRNQHGAAWFRVPGQEAETIDRARGFLRGFGGSAKT